MKEGWRLEVGISIPPCMFICLSSYQLIAFGPLNYDSNNVSPFICETSLEKTLPSKC